MMGLALGVDYALLMVSRFREELADGRRAARRRLDDPPHRRPDDGLRRQHPGALDARRLLRRARGRCSPRWPATAGAGGRAQRRSSRRSPARRCSSCSAPTSTAGGSAPPPNGERSRLMTIVSAALRRPAAGRDRDRRRRPRPRRAGAGAEDRARQRGQLPKDDPARARRRTDPDAGRRAASNRRSSSSPPPNDGPITEPAAARRAEPLAAADRRAARRAERGRPGRVAQRGQAAAQAGHGAARLQRKSRPARQRRPPRPQPGAGDRRRRRCPRRHLARRPTAPACSPKAPASAEEGAIATRRRGLGQATGGHPRPSRRSTRSPRGPRSSPRRSERAALGGLQLKIGCHELVPNLRRNALPLARASLQRSLSDDAEGTVPQLQAPAQVADEQLKAALQQLEGDDRRQVRPQLRRGARSASGRPRGRGGDARPKWPALRANAARHGPLTTPKKSSTVPRKHRSRELRKLGVGARNASPTGSRQDHRRRPRNSPGDGDAGSTKSTRSATANSVRLSAGATELAAGLAHAHRRHRSPRAAASAEGLRPLLSAAERHCAAPPCVISQSGSARPARRPTAPHLAGHLRLRLLRPLGARRRPRPRCANAPPKRSTSNGGGQAATLTVFSRYGFNSPGSIALNKTARTTTPRRWAGKPSVDDRRRRRPGDPQHLQPRDQGADPDRRRRDHARHLPRPRSSSCGRCRWRRSRSASTWPRSASPSASSPCSPTSPTAGRWAATPTSTRSGRR